MSQKEQLTVIIVLAFLAFTTADFVPLLSVVFFVLLIAAAILFKFKNFRKI